MNLRLDKATGLNHHDDEIDLPRPERHGADNDLDLGEHYTDTRAAAESGLDFTAAFERKASRMAGPLLNSMMYKTETDLAWMAGQLGKAAPQERFLAASEKRREAMNKYLWDNEQGRFKSYHLDRAERLDTLAADALAPLFAGVATHQQAERIMRNLPALEREGGVMASELVQSPHQWDGTNGWAPYQVMTIEGARRYGYHEDANRLADKWVRALAKVHAMSGTMFERIDVDRIARPTDDGTKYPTQRDFLFSLASFAWSIRVLGYDLSKLKARTGP